MTSSPAEAWPPNTVPLGVRVSVQEPGAGAGTLNPQRLVSVPGLEWIAGEAGCARAGR